MRNPAYTGKINDTVLGVQTVIPPKAGIRESRQRQPYGARSATRHSRECWNPADPGNGNIRRGGSPALPPIGESDNPATSTIRHKGRSPSFPRKRESSKPRQRQPYGARVAPASGVNQVTPANINHTVRRRQPRHSRQCRNPTYTGKINDTALGVQTVIPAKAGIQESPATATIRQGRQPAIPANAGIRQIPAMATYGAAAARQSRQWGNPTTRQHQRYGIRAADRHSRKSGNPGISGNGNHTAQGWQPGITANGGIQ